MSLVTSSQSASLVASNMKDQLSKLQELLISRLIADFGDEAKCTPGFYTVVRGILSDHKDQVNKIPSESIEAVELAMKNAAPFKMNKAAY
jgi:hypothetical protein